jgi:hypothetical protein
VGSLKTETGLEPGRSKEQARKSLEHYKQNVLTDSGKVSEGKKFSKVV